VSGSLIRASVTACHYKAFFSNVLPVILVGLIGQEKFLGKSGNPLMAHGGAPI
jgi:hypothetical protein